MSVATPAASTSTSRNGGGPARHHDTVVVGAGFAGIGAAIKLEEAGFDDFAVLEKSDNVGGTWRDNTYPGCACDVPSALYSFSFVQNPDWSRAFAEQPEIQDYLERTASDFGVTRRIHYRTEVRDAQWNADDQLWQLDTSAGPYTARVLIAGPGPLHQPKLPDVPGLDSFEGRAFHSARWEHDYDLRGKRVAAVGTGASAIQFVPEIQKQVEQLHVIQRTPPWIMPHPNRPISAREKRLYKRFPLLQKLVRGGAYAGRELFVLGFVKNPKLMKVAEKIARKHMARQISDPALLEKVTPDYTIGCKRILPSNRWYRALDNPNVELLTGGVAGVRPHSVVGGDGGG